MDAMKEFNEAWEQSHQREPGAQPLMGDSEAQLPES